jgi:hypothetical protein
MKQRLINEWILWLFCDEIETIHQDGVINADPARIHSDQDGPTAKT